MFSVTLRLTSGGHRVQIALLTSDEPVSRDKDNVGCFLDGSLLYRILTK